MKKELRKYIGYSSIRVDKPTLNRLDFICGILGVTKLAFVRELINQLFDASSEFKSANIFYLTHGNSVRIDFEGKSVLITGAIPMPNEVSEEACDVAVSTLVEAEISQRKERDNRE